MKKYSYWLLPIGWMGIIFGSSATPYEKQDIKPLLGEWLDLSFLEPLLGWISFTYHQSLVSVETHGIDGLIEFFIRKGAHVTVFFVLCWLFYFAFRKTTSLLTEKSAIVVSVLLTIAYAVIDEVHQGFTPNRTPYMGDVVLDSFGAFIAAVCLLGFQWWKKRLNTDKR